MSVVNTGMQCRYEVPRQFGNQFYSKYLDTLEPNLSWMTTPLIKTCGLIKLIFSSFTCNVEFPDQSHWSGHFSIQVSELACWKVHMYAVTCQCLCVSNHAAYDGKHSVCSCMPKQEKCMCDVCACWSGRIRSRLHFVYAILLSDRKGKTMQIVHHSLIERIKVVRM